MLQTARSTTLSPYTTLFRSEELRERRIHLPAYAYQRTEWSEDSRWQGRHERGKGNNDSCYRGSQRRDHYRGALRCFSVRSEEHTSALQSRGHLVCRLLLAKK